MPTPDDDTIRFWGLASTHRQLAGSALAHRAAAPSLGLANFLYAVVPADADTLRHDLAEAARDGCTRVVVERRTPPWVEAELLLDGWQAEDELRLVLPAGHDLTRAAPSHEVRRADDADPGWAARAAMLRTDHVEEDVRHGVPVRPPARTDATVAHRQDLERHATYYCVLRRGEVAGFVCGWLAPSGQGVVEDVFVAPDHRGHGVATALIHHAVARLRDAGAGPVSIAAEVGDTPGHLYSRLGFRPHHTARSLTALAVGG
ncbi:GNAT family N-acetyltransferase [Promicromonospora sp. NPDC057488]|uniref:GNAT family N-acetyltransferase n=1 Tax=Promicromonospora sp. NPDC057488 TaxID=3346147 RepID=UPI00366D618B